MLTVIFPEPCTAPETAHSQPGTAGSMVQVKLMVPGKSPMDATTTSAVVVEPGRIRTLEGETDRNWKSDPHSSTKFETSIDPQPVARSYPGPAANERNPLGGQSVVPTTHGDVIAPIVTS